MTPGHLFVVRGDVAGLACGWRVVTSGTDGAGVPGEVGDHWLTDPRMRARVTAASWAADAPRAARRAVVAVEPGDGPGVIAVHTGEVGDEDAAWFADAVTAAGRLVLDAAERGAVPSMVLPLLGTGRGGAHLRSDGVLEQVMRRATELAARGVDVVLVAHDRQAYAAAQRLRARDEQRYWPDPAVARRDAEARRLADLARAGKLVPFIGAGVSFGAGLPTWTGLLAELADEAGIVEPGDLDALKKMDARDAASVLQLKLGSGLDTSLRQRFGQRGPSSLTHALIASLPITEAATTNYDRLFEQAWEAACGAAPQVLPKDDASQAARWLLKLHGSVDDEDRPLVLSREEYLGFEQTAGAIAGVLQAMLLTRHLLIVGYGLTDETFHRIAHDVRAVRTAPTVGAMAATTAGGRLGTALLAPPAGLAQDIWAQDLSLISFAEADGDLAASARREAIFLDRVGQLAAPIESYVLGSGWRGLSDNERDLPARQALLQLQAASASLDPRMREAVEDVLRRFGWDA